MARYSEIVSSRAAIKQFNNQQSKGTPKCKKHSLAGSHSQKWKSSKTVSRRFLADGNAAGMGGKKSLYPNGRHWRTSPKMRRNISSRTSCLRCKKKT